MPDPAKARTTRISRDPAIDKKRPRQQREQETLSNGDLPSFVQVISDQIPHDIDESALDFRKQTRAMDCATGKRCVNAKQKRSEH